MRDQPHVTHPPAPQALWQSLPSWVSGRTATRSIAPSLPDRFVRRPKNGHRHDYLRYRRDGGYRSKNNVGISGKHRKTSRWVFDHLS